MGQASQDSHYLRINEMAGPSFKWRLNSLDLAVEELTRRHILKELREENERHWGIRIPIEEPVETAAFCCNLCKKILSLDHNERYLSEEGVQYCRDCVPWPQMYKKVQPGTVPFKHYKMNNFANVVHYPKNKEPVFQATCESVLWGRNAILGSTTNESHELILSEENLIASNDSLALDGNEENDGENPEESITDDNKSDNDISSIEATLSDSATSSSSTTSSDMSVECFMFCDHKSLNYKDLIGHLILQHGISVLDIGDCLEGAKGTVHIPMNNFEEMLPFHKIVRYCKRYFLFCMEFINGLICFFLRRLSNMENIAGESRPSFDYYMFCTDDSNSLLIKVKKRCAPWRSSLNQVFNDQLCLTLSNEMMYLVKNKKIIPNPKTDAEIQERVIVRFKLFYRKTDIGDQNEIEENTSSMESLVEEEYEPLDFEN